MRLRDALLLFVISTAVAGTACSRMTFIKPDARRGNMDRVAPDYSFSETREGRKRAEARGLLVSANRNLVAGELAEAEAQAEAALKLDRGSVDAHTVLGVIATARGSARAAGRHYARAVELAPDNAVALDNHAVWLCANGQAAESLPLFERAMADPGYRSQMHNVLANAGSCAVEAGDSQRSEPYLRMALEFDAAHPVALEAMARLLYREERYFEARAFSERRLAAAAATPSTLVLASQIEHKLGDNVAENRYVQRLQTEFPQARTESPGEIARP